MTKCNFATRVRGLIGGKMRALSLLAWALCFLCGLATSDGSQVFTFSNHGAITINDKANATPFPSTIAADVNPATIITKVQVRLIGFTHTFPDDVDILLVGPGVARSMIMSDAGSGFDVNSITLLFDQSSSNVLADTGSGPLASGTYRPVNYETDVADVFTPGPGSLLNEPADLGVFSTTNPNGSWKLYVVDDNGMDTGTISGGWDLILTVPTVFKLRDDSPTKGWGWRIA